VPAAFAKWLRGPLAKWLHSEPRRTSKAYPQGRHSSRGIGYVDPGDDVLFTFHAAPFHAYASAKKSYGYLYVVAWMD
jgi:hypothetical protein